MSDTPRKEAPAWLCEELFLSNGVFNEDGTTVTGRPSPHGAAVLNVGHGAPTEITVRLTVRDDWEAIRKRLKDEGF